MTEKYATLNEAKQAAKFLLDQLDRTGAGKHESLPKSFRRLSQYADIYPTINLAVEICSQAYSEATEKATEEHKSKDLIAGLGKIAFCGHLPRLSGASNIRDFIACVTYAMSLDIIPAKEATRLLYAAKIAHTAMKRKRSKKSAQSPLKCTPTPNPNQTESTT